MKLVSSFILASALGSAAAAQQQAPLQKNARPNIVVVLTDDQDLHMDSIDYMPLLKKNVIDHGTFYKRHFCSTAICCPSRATLWTGRNAHNTNVTDVFPPYGKFEENIINGPQLISDRRILKIREPRLEQELATTLVARRRLQHLLHG